MTQVLPTILGIWLFWSTIVYWIWNRQLDQVPEETFEILQQQSQDLRAGFTILDENLIQEVLQRTCLDLPCTLQELKIKEGRKPEAKQQNIRIIAQMHAFDIPIFLEVLHRLPYVLLLDGFEIHLYDKQAKILVNLKQFQPNIVQEEWLAQSDIAVEHLELLHQANQVRQWNEFYDQQVSIFEEMEHHWENLFPLLGEKILLLQDLRGVLTYQHQKGFTLMPLEKQDE